MIRELLKIILPYKEIGWKDIGEEFTRYTVLKTPWFNLYLHRLKALTWHDKCHDHPWWFITLILWSGYWELVPPQKYWRCPGTILYRPAKFIHNVVTIGVCWSIVLTGAKSRDWGFVEC